MNSDRSDSIRKITTLQLDKTLFAATEELKVLTASGNIQVDYVTSRPNQKLPDQKFPLTRNIPTDYFPSKLNTQIVTLASRNTRRDQRVDSLKTEDQLYFEHLRLKSSLATPKQIGKIGPSELRGILFQNERQLRLQQRAMRHQSMNRRDPHIMKNKSPIGDLENIKLTGDTMQTKLSALERVQLAK